MRFRLFHFDGFIALLGIFWGFVFVIEALGFHDPLAKELAWCSAFGIPILAFVLALRT